MKAHSFRNQFLSQNALFQPFLHFPYPFHDWEKIIEKRKAFGVNRSLLCHYLLSYHSQLPYFEVACQQIEKLRNPNSFTICTGQQPGLYGGPLFTWYKAIYTILCTIQLKQRYPEYDFIPIFFLASEDHDTKEVNRAWISYHHYVEYPHFQPNETIGRHLLQPFPKKGIPSWAQSFLLPGERWSHAFAKCLLTYLGPYGLLVFDPDDFELKKNFIPIMKNALLGSHFALLKEQTEKLQLATKRKPPLTPREINLFYIDEKNQRYGIIRRGSTYIAGPYQWQKEEILSLLSASPQSFSPSAALRPLYQEFFLPNLAYVGGWTEIHYWLQLKSLFDSENVFFPYLIPRPSLLIFPPDLLELWQNQFKLSPEAILLDEAQIISSYFQRYDSFQTIAEILSLLKEKIANELNAINQIDPFLAGYTEHIQKKFQNYSTRVLQRHIKHLKHWNKEVHQGLVAIKRKVQPDGHIQERTLSLLAIPHPQQFFQEILASSLKEGGMSILSYFLFTDT